MAVARGRWVDGRGPGSPRPWRSRWHHVLVRARARARTAAKARRHDSSRHDDLIAERPSSARGSLRSAGSEGGFHRCRPPLRNRRPGEHAAARGRSRAPPAARDKELAEEVLRDDQLEADPSTGHRAREIVGPESGAATRSTATISRSAPQARAQRSRRPARPQRRDTMARPRAGATVGPVSSAGFLPSAACVARDSRRGVLCAASPDREYSSLPISHAAGQPGGYSASPPLRTRYRLPNMGFIPFPRGLQPLPQGSSASCPTSVIPCQDVLLMLTITRTPSDRRAAVCTRPRSGV